MQVLEYNQEFYGYGRAARSCYLPFMTRRGKGLMRKLFALVVVRVAAMTAMHRPNTGDAK